jgi:hypothetical protein
METGGNVCGSGDDVPYHKPIFDTIAVSLIEITETGKKPVINNFKQKKTNNGFFPLIERFIDIGSNYI